MGWPQGFFVRDAPATVRAAACLVVAGSVLEAVHAARFHWPGQLSIGSLWMAFFGPAGGLATGLVLSVLIARMVVWGYWLLVLVWVPLIALGTGLAAWKMAARDGGPIPADPWWLFTLTGLLCYLGAAVLLISGPARRAVRRHGRHRW